MARQFATLDHLSGGRAGWNIVTSSDAFTGANFRRGGFLDYADRYARAEEFLTVARRFWDSWDADAVLADLEAGMYVDPDQIHSVEYRESHFGVRGFATLPSGPQGHPILLQAGDSADGRNFGARYADALFTLHSSLGDGRLTTQTSRAGLSPSVEIPTSSRFFPLRRLSSATPTRRPRRRRGTSAINR